MKSRLLHLFAYSFLALNYFFVIGSESQFSNIQVEKIISTDNGYDVILTSNTVYLHDGANLIDISSHLPDLKTHAPFNDVQIINNHYWLSAHDALIAVDLTTNQITPLTPNPISKLKKFNNQMYFISQGEIFTTVKNTTKSVFNIENQIIRDYVHVEKNQLWTLVGDRLLLLNLNTKQIEQEINLFTQLKKISSTQQGELIGFSDTGKLYIVKNGILSQYKELAGNSLSHYQITEAGFLYYISNNVLFKHDLVKKTTQRIAQNVSDFKISNSKFWLKKTETNEWTSKPLNKIVYTVTNNQLVHLLAKNYGTTLKSLASLNDDELLLLTTSGIDILNANTGISKQLITNTEITNINILDHQTVLFFDDTNAYTYSFIDKAVKHRFPIANALGSIQTRNGQTIIFTATQLYQLTASSYASILHQNIGRISAVSTINSDLYIAADNGLWRARKIDGNWQYLRVIESKIRYVAATNSSYLWLFYNNKVALFDPSNNQLMYVSNIEQFRFIIKNSHPIRILDDDLNIKQLIRPELLNNKPSPLKVSHLVIHANNQRFINLTGDLAHHNPTHIELFFTDGTVDRQHFKLAYQIGESTLWHPLSEGQSHLVLTNLASSINIKNMASPTTKITTVSLSPGLNYILWTGFIMLGIVATLLLSFYIDVKRKRKSPPIRGIIATLLRQTEEAVWIADKDFKIIQINKKFTDITL